MAGREIGNTAALKEAADYLNILGGGEQQHFPNVLAQGDIQAVYPLGVNQWDRRKWNWNNRQTNINGVAVSLANQLIGPGLFSAIANDNFATATPPVDKNTKAAPLASADCRVTTCKAQVVFDAAGALAFVGKTLSYYLVMDSSLTTLGQLNSFSCYIGESIVTVGAPLIYEVNPFGQNKGATHIQCGWDGFVPSNFTLGWIAVSDDGTVFPANTKLKCFVSCFMDLPGRFIPV